MAAGETRIPTTKDWPSRAWNSTVPLRRSSPASNRFASPRRLTGRNSLTLTLPDSPGSSSLCQEARRLVLCGEPSGSGRERGPRPPRRTSPQLVKTPPRAPVWEEAPRQLGGGRGCWERRADRNNYALDLVGRAGENGKPGGKVDGAVERWPLGNNQA